jgi:hypothetical protein
MEKEKAQKKVIPNVFEERETESGFEYVFKTDTKIPAGKIEDIENSIISITTDGYKKISDKLDKAIAAFEDENSEKPFSERFSLMRWGWMYNAYETMKYIKKNGAKNPISDNKRYIQEEGIRQFGIMEKMYNSELKAGEKKGKKQEDIDTEWLKEVKKMKSSIGDIVRTTQKANE